jgi:ribosomal peptide maturation radical SAM protein 1
MASVLLISMPWCAASRPNLSVGILKALAERAGHTCRVYDANLKMAERIGAEAYEVLAETPSIFGLCEHVFACDVFGQEPLRSEDYLERFEASSEQGVFRQLRDQIVPDFLDDLEAEIANGAHEVVGFSCTFNQVFPSIAIAARLKRRDPDKRVLLGGACVHGEMGEEYARAFRDIIDHVFLGEADASFPQLLDALDAGDDPRSIAGITVEGQKTGEPRPIHSLGGVPMPDYRDFFDMRRAMTAAGARLPEVLALPYEGSRGCWWGEKHHCTFCGLNNLGMNFRAKAPDVVAREVETLATRHQTLRFMASDNIITHRDFKALLEELSALDGEFSFFYEVKANLKRAEVAALAAAGVRWIQPGIEAFSDAQLKRMEKGCTALQNVHLLRLCAEFGIRPSFNILVGFPGETEQDYADQIDVAERIMHLPAPSGPPGLVQVHRFSPFHANPDAYGFLKVRPMAYYAHLVPDGFADLDRISYFFDRDMAKDTPYRKMILSLNDVVSRWQSADRKLSIRLGPGFSEVLETRHGEADKFHSLNRLQTAILVFLDRPRATSALAQLAGPIAEQSGADLNAELEVLKARGLIVGHGAALVSTVPYMSPQTDHALVEWLELWGAVSPRGKRAGTARSQAAEELHTGA